jgi:hypothetical protein
MPIAAIHELPIPLRQRSRNQKHPSASEFRLQFLLVFIDSFLMFTGHILDGAQSCFTQQSTA